MDVMFKINHFDLYKKQKVCLETVDVLAQYATIVLLLKLNY